jgi:hypothetical protein
MSPNQKKDPIPAALLMLTLVTGIVDAVSVLALGHVFTANMTGNVVFLAFAVAGASQFSIARSLASLVAFLMGAVPAAASALRWQAPSEDAGSCRPQFLRRHCFSWRRTSQRNSALSLQLLGVLLVVAMTVGYIATDKLIGAKFTAKGPATTKELGGGPTGLPHSRTGT